jgi:serine/threonine protein kinase
LIKSLHINQIEYQIQHLIAKGGFGRVLEVRNTQGEIYALKVPLDFDEHFTNCQGNSGIDLQYSRRFLVEEIRALQALPNDSTVDIVFCGHIFIPKNAENIEIPVILMEKAESSLLDIILNEAYGVNFIPLAEKEKMITGMLQAFKIIQDKHIAHRDLSPDNVLAVTREKNDSWQLQFVISDFGSSKMNVHEITSSTIVSTRLADHYPYSDPKKYQFDNLRSDIRCDIYSLGVIAAEIFLGNTWVRILNRDTDKIINLESTEPNFEKNVLNVYLKKYLDNALYKVIKKAVCHSIEKRYTSVDEFLQEFRLYFKQLKKRSVQNELSVSRTLVLYPRLEFSIPKNLDTEIQQIELDYVGRDSFSIDFNDYLINFRNKCIRSCKIIGSRLFVADYSDHAISLLINRAYIKKHYQPFKNEFLSSNAEFRFNRFSVEIMYQIKPGAVSE